VYAVNPQVVGRYRGRHQVSRAKSDRSLAEAVKVLARAHQSLVWVRQRHVNALRSALREFCPGALAALGTQLAEPEALAVLQLAPTPEQGRRLTRAAVRQALVGGETCKRESWRSTTRCRRRSLPHPRQWRRPTARW
jgi:hypothetical protein